MDNGGAEFDLEPGEYTVMWEFRVPLKPGDYTLLVGLGAQVEGQIDTWVAQPTLTVLDIVDAHLPNERRSLVSEDIKMEILKR